MKNRLFPILLILISLLLGGCAPAVTEDSEPLREVTFADYQKYEVENGVPKKKFDITYYFGPTPNEFLANEDFYRLIAECGFTTVQLQCKRDKEGELDGYEVRKQVLNKLKEYGLTVTGMDLRPMAEKNKYEERTKEEFENWVKEAHEAFKDCDNLCEWYIQDEPNASLFGKLGEINEAIREYDPYRAGFINILPSYAGEPLTGTETYEEYLDRYIAEVKPFYLCFDYYQHHNGVDGFYENIELIRQKALENDLPYENIVLLTVSDGETPENLTREEIAWEITNSLVYGTKRVSYFTFYLTDYYMEEEHWTNACVDYLGNKYPHYEDVQAINRWLLPLGTELYDKTSTAVFHAVSGNWVPYPCTKYESYGKLGKVTPNGEFVIGFFDDDSFMITSKAYYSKMEGKMTLDDLGYKDKLEFFDTKTAHWRPASECELITVPQAEGENYSLTLKLGDAVLLRVAD